MAGHTDDEIIKLVKGRIEPAIVARIAKMESSIKHIEETFKEVLKIAALEKEVAKQASLMELMKGAEKRGVSFHEAMMKKAHDELVVVRGDTAKIHAAVAKMDAKLAKTELLEARLQGMEMMIKSMEQTIDMLQRKR